MKTTLALALTTALTFASATTSQALDLTNLSADERNAFRDEVRAYLLDNPEVLVEALNVLDERKAMEQAALNKELVRVNADELFNDGFSHVAGNPEGTYTIVEFVDYQCGYCRKSHEVVTELLEKDGDIRLVLKEFPILSEASVLSSQFAISAQQLFGEEAYAKLHEALITVRGNIDRARLISIAGELDLDGEKIADNMGSEEVGAVLQRNRELGQRLQINGTPAFVMHDDMARGYMPLEQMEAIIAAYRTEG